MDVETDLQELIHKRLVQLFAEGLWSDILENI